MKTTLNDKSLNKTTALEQTTAESTGDKYILLAKSSPLILLLLMHTKTFSLRGDFPAYAMFYHRDAIKSN